VIAGTRREFSERCAWQARKLAEAAEHGFSEEEAPGVNPARQTKGNGLSLADAEPLSSTNTKGQQ
jgi:hypothetical protein